jgi:peptidoglycan/LPS O-acetylase OafA/YrhL
VERSRIPVLDVLRFVAALSVLCFHYGFRGYSADNLLITHFTALSPVARYGYLGVYLFFMISGFVILMSAEGRSAAAFFQSRFIRLYPAYWVACTITFASMYLLGATNLQRTFDQWLVNLSMLQGTFGVTDIDGVYWTLLLEMRFYLLVFLVCATGLFGALPILLAGWAGYAFVAMRGLITPDVAAIYPSCIYFIAGAAFYLIYRRRSLVLASALVVVSGYLAYRHCADDAVKQSAYYHATISPVVATCLMGLFFVVFALIALGRLRMRERAWTYAMGAMTYPLYLLHQFMGYALLNKVAVGAVPYLWLLLVVLFLLALAWAVHRFLEVPGARLLRTLFAAGAGRGRGPVG